MDFKKSSPHSPSVKSFFDTETNTISYVVSDSVTKKCAVIDSVMNYEPHSGTVTYIRADEIILYIQENNFIIEWILETHVHADHLSAAIYIKEKLGGKIAISRAITHVQDFFGNVFDESEQFLRDGSQFDVLFGPDEEFTIGSIPSVALFVPGHTPADIAYVVGDSVFVGDTIFMPDYGSARCDFPGGSATMLYNSVQKLFTLPNDTKLYMCHDYLPEGRSEYLWQTTIAEEKEKNIHLAGTITEKEFADMRTKRDEHLGMPRLIIPSLQVNMRAGKLPIDKKGKIFLKLPINSILSKK